MNRLGIFVILLSLWHGLILSGTAFAAGASFFSSSYFEARQRFKVSAIQRGFQLESHPIAAQGPGGQGLTIDVAIREATSADAPTLLISSGVHGAEGFLGSAAQLEFLSNLNTAQDFGGIRIVLIHAVNPYGFAWIRRNNEDNVDLNRNFLRDTESYSGTPPGYESMAGLLDAHSPPSNLDFFYTRMLWGALFSGIQKTVAEVPQGQYGHPRGLFYGGANPSESMLVFLKNYARWIGNSQRVVQVDFHTGLFKNGEYFLLQDTEQKTLDDAAFEKTFSQVYTKKMRDSSWSYTSRGTLAHWATCQYPQKDFRFLVAEFGTMNELRVLSRLRSENQNFWFGEKENLNHWTKSDLREAFYPNSEKWKEQSIIHSQKILNQSASWLKRP